MDPRRERLAKNEALFREVNERVKEVAQSFDVAGHGEYRVDFVCECGNEGCFEQISLSPAEYEDVRASAVRFAVLPGHITREVDRVVAENDRYVTVEKLGESAQRAAEYNPRA